MIDYNKESELKDILRERKAEKRAILYTAVFGALFIGYLLAHLVLFLLTPPEIPTIDGVLPRNDAQVLNGYNN
jgi:hypothetical protein